MDGSLNAAAGALFHDGDGRVLLVEPTYKTNWEIPGGMMEGVESPREGCLRELREELGLDVELGALLVVDWEPRPPSGGVRFVFDGGRLDEAQVRAIVLPATELRSWAWVALDAVAERVNDRLARRLRSAAGALAASETWYLEQGARP